MLKAPVRSGVVVAGLIAVLAFDLVVGGVLGAVLGTTLFANRNTTPSASAQRTTTSPPLTTVTIAQGQGLFEPFILAVPPNTTVTWRNNDAVAHTIVTTPDQEGVIWVKGAISNLPSATTNRIPPKHDDFVSEFLAITPGSVSWHNFDSDPHFVAVVPGWSATNDPPQAQAEINPTDIGVNRIAGTDDVPGGDTIAVRCAPWYGLAQGLQWGASWSSKRPTIASHTSVGCDLVAVERDRLDDRSADPGHARG